MIEKSESNLSAYRDRVRLEEADFNTFLFQGEYDAIISAIAIHNSSHAQKKGLFDRIYDALKPKRVFVNGDFIEGETARLDTQSKRVYREFLENNLSGRELDAWLRHAFEQDQPMRLSQQFRLLKEQGFSDIRLV